jgi:hypothetical protein
MTRGKYVVEVLKTVIYVHIFDDENGNKPYTALDVLLIPVIKPQQPRAQQNPSRKKAGTSVTDIE